MRDTPGDQSANEMPATDKHGAKYEDLSSTLRFSQQCSICAAYALRRGHSGAIGAIFAKSPTLALVAKTGFCLVKIFACTICAACLSPVAIGQPVEIPVNP